MMDLKAAVGGVFESDHARVVGLQIELSATKVG